MVIGVFVDDDFVVWGDLVVQYFLWFEFVDVELMQKMMLCDLLSYSLGIVEDVYLVMGFFDGCVVVECVWYLENMGEYGVYCYSNFGYGLLGFVVEEVMGQSWMQFVQECFFDFFGMILSVVMLFGVWDVEYVVLVFLGIVFVGFVLFDDVLGFNVVLLYGVDCVGECCVLFWQFYDNMQVVGSVVLNVCDMSCWL